MRSLKSGGAGWYHDCSSQHFGCIEWLDEHPRGETSLNGPWATFNECKADAIAYHQCDLDGAKAALREIRATRKPHNAKVVK